jgi:RNA binding exosome subunit
LIQITIIVIYLITVYTTIEGELTNMVIGSIMFNFADKEREMLIDPIYKRIDKNGRIYVDRDLAEQEALFIVVKPIPQDKIDYIKVGRSK